MNTALRRIHPAITMVALCISLLALVAAAAGAGYAAATIGTAQLKNNAVTAPKIKNNAVTTKKVKNNAITSKKVKNGALSADDLVAEEKQILATLSNGGEGDCVWQGLGALVSGVGLPTFRKDRFGTVHLNGGATAASGAGGDATCDPSDPGQTSDAIAFILPAAYIPAKTQLFGGVGGLAIIAGPTGATFSGGSFPPGAVVGVSGGIVLLDGATYDPVGSPVVLPKVSKAAKKQRDLRKALGLD
jgi:hypothetical protein